VADTYRDGWGLDKEQALAYSREIFGQFLPLRIRPQEMQVQLGSGDQGQATLWFIIEGSGGPLANLTRDQVNALEQPFRLTWQRRKRYRWELTRLENPALELPLLPGQGQAGQR
jgi:hypothetical protein